VAVNAAAQAGEFDRCAQLTQEILKIAPADVDTQRFMVALHLEEGNKRAELRTWAEKMMTTHAADAEVLTTLANQLADVPDIRVRPVDLALRAAAAAQEADPRDVSAIQTLAKVRYLIGDVGGAVELQKKAVRMANVLDVEAAQEVLKYYKACLALQSQAVTGG
jgi:hypothetical protein